MSDTNKTVLSALVAVSKLDGALARTRAEQKQIEQKLAEKRKALEEQQAQADRKARAFEERKKRYSKEEKILKDERLKLVDRRKSLDSLNNYKLQQAAQREIEHASKQLDLHEDGLLRTLDEIGSVESDLSGVREQLQKLRESYEQELKDAQESLAVLKERERIYTAQREEAAHGILPALLAAYDRVKDRYPMDALVPIKPANTCSGCFMNLGPQVPLKVSRGEGVVYCPGCRRILFLQEAEEE